MKRKLLIGFVVLLVLLGGALWWTLSSLDSLVKGALEYYGPKVLGVSVAVGNVELSAKSGRGVVRDVVIGSPSGYEGPHTVRVGEAVIAIDANTLRDDVVVIREISIEAPAINYELVGGKANLEVIQANIERALQASKAAAEPSTAGGPKAERRYVIHAVNIRKAQVRVTNPLLKGGGLDFVLPDINLRRIGKEGGGMTGGEVAKIITTTLVLRIAAKALTGGQILERGVDGVLDILKGVLKPQ